MAFRITGLDAEPFRHLYSLPAQELAAHRAVRMAVDRTPGFPDRIEMRDMEPGETALLVHYTHQSADTPYHASHAVFVREGAETAYDSVDTIPEVLSRRLLSVRAFDGSHMMLNADVTEGTGLRVVIERFLADPTVAYLHLHNAKPGCYAARVERKDGLFSKERSGGRWPGKAGSLPSELPLQA